MRRMVYKALAIVAALAACSEPSAPTGNFEAARKSVHQITATDLDLPGDGQAYDNNNRGQVVGEADVFGVWQKGDFQEIAVLPGYDNGSGEAINSSGAIVGSSVRVGQQGRAELWDHGRMQDLGLLPGDVNSGAHAINDAGDIVGVSTAGRLDTEHAFLWHQGQLIALGTLPGDVASEAWGIDNAGRVVGYSWTAFSGRPFVWDHGVMTELSGLDQPGVGFTITRDGEVVAWKCPNASGDPAAEATRRVGVVVYIPCPTDAADQSAADVIVDIEDINSSGQAVGNVWRGVRENDDDFRWEVRGYLWSGGERFLLPPVAGQPDAAIEPHAINDRGEIAGHSSVGATLWTTK